MKKFVLMLALAALPAVAQIQVALDGLAAKASDTSGVTLDSNMLKLAAGFLAGDKSQDPELQKILGGLKSIVVKSYKFKQAGQYSDAELAPLRQQLSTNGWSVMVSHNSPEERSAIYTRIDGNSIAGITIISAKPKEVAVVSIEGMVDLAKLAQLAGHFGIPTALPSGDNKK